MSALRTALALIVTFAFSTVDAALAQPAPAPRAAPPARPPMPPRTPPQRPPAAVAAQAAEAAKPKAPEPTIAELKASCDAKDVKACTALVYRYGDKDSPIKNEAEELKYRVRSCDLGEFDQCAFAGYAYAHGEGAPKNMTRALAYLKRGCDADDGYACGQLADAYQDGDGVKADANLALELNEKACRFGGSIMCDLILGEVRRFYENAGLAEGAPPRPLGAEQATCVRGDANACMRAAFRYEIDNPPQAAADLAAACDRKIGQACLFLGNMLQDAYGIKRNDAAAAAIYLNGCILEEGSSCAALGDMYRRGHGVPKDLAKADLLRARGCSFYAASCPIDMAKAAEAKRKATPAAFALPTAPAAAAPAPRQAAPASAPGPLRSARAPIDPASTLGRGVALHRSKDFQPALQMLLQAARTDPGDPRVFVYLADTYAWLGMNQEASQAAATATRLDPMAMELLRAGR